MSARRFLVLLAVLAVLCAGFYYVFLRSAAPQQQQEQAQVDGLPHDGDTFRIFTAGNSSVPVRVLGIDAPEVSPEQCYSSEATDAARALLSGQTVFLTADPQQGDRDRYGRLLRYVQTPTEEDLSAYLVRNGYARVYEEYPVARTPEYLRLQEQAKAEKKGGWRECSW